MSDKEKVVRIPFTLYRDNPEHEKVYSILEKQKNRNAFIRSAVLAYYAQEEMVVILYPQRIFVRL